MFSMTNTVFLIFICKSCDTHPLYQPNLNKLCMLCLFAQSHQPRDRTQVSHIAGGFFTDWATRKPKNTGVGRHALLQGIFPSQGSNPGLPHCRQILYRLSHQGSPWILERVAYSFSRESSRHRNWTRVSCIAGGFFTIWATHLYKNIFTNSS